MKNYIEYFIDCMQHKKYDALQQNFPEIPTNFNWVRDVYENIFVQKHKDKCMLQFVSYNKSPIDITYEQARVQCNQFVNFLRKKGIKEQSSIFIMCGLHPELWISYLGSIKGGYILLPSANVLTVNDIVYRLQSVDVPVVLSDLDNYAKIDEAEKKIGKKIPVKILIDGEKNGWYNFTEIYSEQKEAKASDTKKDDTIFYFFTSGTTGMPKIVEHVHGNYTMGMYSVVGWIGLTPNDKHYNISQAGWAKFAWSCFFSPLCVGATIFIYKPEGRFDAKEQLTIIEKYKVTTFCAPPTVYRAFIKEDLSKYKFNLKQVVGAGEPLNPEVIEVWKNGTGITIRDGYGQSETNALVCNMPDAKVKYGSMGKPTFLFDMVIADDKGNELLALEEGQITVRIHKDKLSGVFRSYYNDEAKTKSAYIGNLYYTGDKGYKDEDGYFWFVGRNDDIIKSSDYRIGPFEVESVLLEVSGVMETAVVGSPHARKGEEVKAFIVLTDINKTGADTAKQIFNHCLEHIARYKMPRIIEFVDQLPKTISGKIRRVELRANEATNKAKNIRGKNEFYYEELYK